MQPQVVVVGSFVQDLTWQCAAFPHAGETVVGTFVTGPGGKGSNQAVAAGRAGARTLFIGAVGQEMGQLLAAVRQVLRVLRVETLDLVGKFNW